MRRNHPLRIAYAAALTLAAIATTASPSAANDLYNTRFCANMRDSIVFYIFQIQKNEEDKRQTEQRKNRAELNKDWTKAREFEETAGNFEKMIWDLYPKLSYLTGLYNGMGCQSRPTS
jgi:hypothetical protein